MTALAVVTTDTTAATAADYARLRDRIEAAAALTRQALVSVDVLDDEAADALPVTVKADAADRVWSRLMAEINRLDV